MMILAVLTAGSLPLDDWFRRSLPLLYKMYATVSGNPGDFVTALADHILLLVVVPVLLAIFVAVPLGIVATRYPAFERVVMVLVNVIQTIPSLALLVLLLVAGLGLGKVTAITALFLYSLLPILRNTVVGIKSVDPFLKEAALGMGMTSLQRLRMVELPLALSVIITGVRTATIICIGTGTLAAYVGGGGLGTYIVRGLAFYRNDMLLVGALPAALLALLADHLLGRLERRLIPRGLRASPEAGTRRRTARTRTTLAAALAIALSLLALPLSACGTRPPAAASTTFKIGTQGYAEVEILGELFKALVEAKTPHRVEHVRSLGSSTAGFEATVRNDLQMFTSFTGTLFLGLLEQTLTDEYRDPDKVFVKTKELLLERHKLYAAPPYGYNNTYAIAVPRAWAEANRVTRQSDLAPFAKDMVLAVDQTWLDYPGQGYNEYKKLYGFAFKATPAMEMGLIYRSIDKGEVDAVNVYSTDGQLVAQDLLVLEDDKGFNPPYYGILVLRQDVVEQYPEVKTLADSLQGLISTEQMQLLNKQVAVEQKEPGAVAREFLKAKGMID